MLKWEDAEKLEELLKDDRYPSKEWKAASLPGRVEWLQKECKKLSDMCIEKNNILIKIYSEQLQKDEEELEKDKKDKELLMLEVDYMDNELLERLKRL